MDIYTHLKSDADAVFSVCAALEFVPGAHNAHVVFVSANWDGAGMKDGDLALDIEAGGCGWKGEKKADMVHSCFATVVERYASPSDQKILAPLVAFVDEVDTHGFFPLQQRMISGMSEKDCAIFAATNLNAVFYAFREAYADNDKAFLWIMSKYFSGVLKQGRSHQEALAKAFESELFGGGAVAILRDCPRATGILFSRGVRAIVYVDGKNLGLGRADGVELRMDHPELRAIVEAAGEEFGNGKGKWFAHSSGFLFCRGSIKAPANDFSKVDPRALAETVAKLLV